MNEVLEKLKEHIKDYVEAHKQINEYERDLATGAPTAKGFSNIVEGFNKAGNTLAKIGKLLEDTSKTNPNNQDITEFQKSLSKALQETNDKFKSFFNLS